MQGKPTALLICPGQPLLDVTIDLLLEQNRDVLTQGAVLVNPNDDGDEVRVLFYLEHTIQDAGVDTSGKRRAVSRQLQFVELDATGTISSAGYAPFLDYRPLREEEQALLSALRAVPWLKSDLEEQARTYAITQLVPRHLTEVRQRREAQVNKTMAAVIERLSKEMSYWDARAVKLEEQEAGGKVNARLNSQKARDRTNDLEARLKRRMQELEQERRVSPLPPVVVGGVLVVPQGLLDRHMAVESSAIAQFARDTARSERIAMQAVMGIERELGYVPRDVSADKCGYDIESSVPGTGKLRFLEVKGRIKGAETVIVTRNEVLTALNKPEDFFLVVVEIDDEEATVHYISKPFQREPDFDATSVMYNLDKLFHKVVRVHQVAIS